MQPRPRGCAGSSPHTRGAHAPVVPGRSLSRIIPAYAGSTAPRRPRVPGDPDHPRIRGEHIKISVTADTKRGSSPHTRGAPFGTHRVPVDVRDHPRIRGEHVNLLIVSDLPPGSSPHTRGAPSPPRTVRFHRGIIPAYAGSTVPEARRQQRRADHPRIRGEHHYISCSLATSRGSSPHTRGAPRRRLRDRRHSRIIPAYAGSTSPTTPHGARQRDHPRIRGEHLRLGAILRQKRGSSPHTRGARRLSGRAPICAGIIPAYAGSTPISRSPTRPARDHPRIRGEHFRHAPSAGRRQGSSPHTRGARRDPVVVAEDLGIIPAYAGSTQRRTALGWRPRDHPRIRGEH